MLIENLKPVHNIYLLVFVCFFVLVWFACIKIMYPFWNSQPVFHSYDFWRYWTKTPFFIGHKKGQKPGKFCDFDHVLTVDFLDMSAELKLEMLDLLHCHFICDEKVIFFLSKENLDAYHCGHLSPCYVSFYLNDYSDLDVSCGEVVVKKRCDALISSRSVTMTFFGSGVGAGANMHIYFMDFITLRRGGDINLSRKLMATHCWRSLGFFDGFDSGTVSDSDSSDHIRGAIFRKEGAAFAGIRPFLSFDSHVYRIAAASFVKPVLPAHFSIVSIHAKNAGLLSEFLQNMCANRMGNCDVLIMSSLPNLMELVKRRILFIYLVRRGDTSFCLYVFRDTRCQYEFDVDDSGYLKNGSLLQLVCCLQNSNSHELFYHGFLNILHDLLNDGDGKLFRYLMVDDIADNRLITDEFPLSAFLETIMVNYYAYNLVMPTVRRALILV